MQNIPEPLLCQIVGPVIEAMAKAACLAQMASVEAPDPWTRKELANLSCLFAYRSNSFNNLDNIAFPVPITFDSRLSEENVNMAKRRGEVFAKKALGTPGPNWEALNQMADGDLIWKLAYVSTEWRKNEDQKNKAKS